MSLKKYVDSQRHKMIQTLDNDSITGFLEHRLFINYTYIHYAKYNDRQTYKQSKTLI